VLHFQGKKVEAFNLLKKYVTDDSKNVPFIAVARLLEEFRESNETNGRELLLATLLYKQNENALKEAPMLLAGAKLLRAEFLARVGLFGDSLDLCDEVRHMPGVLAENPLSVAVETLVREDLSETGKKRAAQDQKRVADWIDAALKAPGLPTDRRANLLQGKANLFILQNNAKAAEGAYRDCLAMNEKDVVALNNLAWLLAIQGKDEALGQSQFYMKRAIEITGPVATLVDTRATIYIALGKYDDAVKDLREVVDDNLNGQYTFHLAQALWVRNKGTDRIDAVQLGKRAFGKELHLDLGALHPLDRGKYPDLMKALEVPGY
jgi:tetratricopeptide (TPR) repeat protein